MFVDLKQKMGSNSANSILADTISGLRVTQDLEIAQAIQLMQNGNTLQDFTAARRNELMNTIQQEHSDTAMQNLGNYTRAQDSLNAVMYYSARTNDLDTVQGQILDRAKSEADAAVHDSDLAKRQFEINEWSAANKAETLFMMQLLLMAVTFTIFLLFLNRMGVVPMSVFSAVSFLLLVAFILTFAIRYQYTAYSRNNRYWNRKRFGSMSTIETPPSCPGVDGSSSSRFEAGLSNVFNYGERLLNAQQIGLLGIQTAFGNAANAFTD
jgi:hypothetical protein